MGVSSERTAQRVWGAAHCIEQVIGQGGQQVARAPARPVPSLPPSRWEEERRWLFGQVKEEERRRVTCADISYKALARSSDLVNVSEPANVILTLLLTSRH